MEFMQSQQLFTLEEVAKWSQLSRGAIYMHFRRGHIKPEPMLSHRLYFSRSEVERFIANYRPIIL